MNDLCGNTWCKHNNKQCECMIDKGLDFGSIEDVENTGDKELIDIVYNGRTDCYEEDSKYVETLYTGDIKVQQ